MSKMILFALVAFAGAAQAMTDARGLTCAQASAFVQQEGAVILRTGTHTYDRYVANGSFCMTGERAKSAWVQTSDSDACMVGYVCRQHDHN